MYRIVFQSEGSQLTTLLTIFLFMLFVGLTALTVEQREYLAKKKVVFGAMVIATAASFILGFVFLFNTLLRSSKYVVVTNVGIYIAYFSGSESIRWEDIDSIEVQKNPISSSMNFYLKDENQINFDLTYIERSAELEEIIRQNIKLEQF